MKILLDLFDAIKLIIFDKTAIKFFYKFFISVSSSLLTLIAFLSFVFTINHQRSINKCEDIIDRIRNKEIKTFEKLNLLLERYKIIYTESLKSYETSIKVFNFILYSIGILWIYVCIGIIINKDCTTIKVLVSISGFILFFTFIYVTINLKKITTNIKSPNDLKNLDVFLPYTEMIISDFFKFTAPCFYINLICDNKIQLSYENKLSIINYKLLIIALENDSFIHLGINTQNAIDISKSYKIVKNYQTTRKIENFLFNFNQNDIQSFISYNDKLYRIKVNFTKPKDDPDNGHLVCKFDCLSAIPCNSELSSIEKDIFTKLETTSDEIYFNHS